MAILAFDLGGTKLASAVFADDGLLIEKDKTILGQRAGRDVARLIVERIGQYAATFRVDCIGVSVPGISHQHSGTVWAPNIPGWEDYPLRREIRECTTAPVRIDSDRACSILGELWKGNAAGCRNAIFLAVGTGIGAGILADGVVLRGAHDIAGAVGWMALPKPFHSKYIDAGCLEFYASGPGIAKFTIEVLQSDLRDSALRHVDHAELSAQHVFDAFDRGDAVAKMILGECISYWGMASANLVSIFNPEKIVFGGGIFGPAARFISDIRAEASRWAQPISMKEVVFDRSALGPDAALYGAAFLASKPVDSIAT